MALSTDSVHELIHDNVLLVDRIARQVFRKMQGMVEFEDLRQIGLIALVEAANRFEPDRYVPFELWASRRVRGAMTDGLSALTGISRAHVRAIVTYARFEQASTGTHEQLNRTMRLFSLPESQKSFERERTPYIRMVRGENAESAIDTHHVHEQLQDPAKQSIAREQVEIAVEALAALPTEERTILTGHYLEGRTLADIADDRGVSRSWLSRLHRRALANAKLLVDS